MKDLGSLFGWWPGNITSWWKFWWIAERSIWLLDLFYFYFYKIILCFWIGHQLFSQWLSILIRLCIVTVSIFSCFLPFFNFHLHRFLSSLDMDLVKFFPRQTSSLNAVLNNLSSVERFIKPGHWLNWIVP